MTISKIKKVANTSTIKKSPVLQHKLQKKLIDKKSHRITETSKKGLSIQEHRKAIMLYQKHYEKGVTIDNAIHFSLKEDIERANTQLRAFYIKSLQEDVFKFIVKSSGLHQEDSYQVDIKFDVSGFMLDNLNSKEIFAKASIKFQCSCPRHTYWYRYVWTVAKASLGIQEHRFPEVRNADLQGMMCKHGLKVIQNIKHSSFQVTFQRYIDNKKVQLATRISKTDKVKIASSSFGAKASR
ncbi:MAG: hypothetical protein ACWGHH_06620 [Sulfurovaceae bacterium]